MPLRRGELRYNLGYEPYEVTEAARPDAWPGGRRLAAELGYTPWRWLGIYGGLRKVAFSYGHDEPEQALALPVRPSLSNSLAPDRRLGLTVRVIAGLYESARTFAAYPSSDVLVTARGVMEPFGPVGRSISTRDDDPSWRRRLRVAFNVSALLDWDPRGGRPVGLVIGGDLPIKYGPLGVVVEYLYGYNAPSEDPGAAPGLRAHRQGAWAQASLMLLRPYLELEGRYEWLDAPTRPLQRFHALTAGVTSSLVRDYLKVQAAYGTRLHYGGPAVQDDYLLLQLQVAE